ncbi:hypothetical protein BJX68DRAFT_224444 [Aspergillus pseudodeflectus]|uniref:Uncharacterized protein n=1 Tax=Aspergillus pseudodeflectus TaxID=176178 RepID=A0ABR4L6U5_9EURO
MRADPQLALYPISFRSLSSPCIHRNWKPKSASFCVSFHERLSSCSYCDACFSPLAVLVLIRFLFSFLFLSPCLHRN